MLSKNNLRIRNQIQEMKEIKNLPQSQENNWFDILEINKLQHVIFVVYGPIQSPYQNMGFRIKLTWSHDFPFKAPQVQFIDPVWSPYIDQKGNICLDIFNQMWSPALGARTILLSIISILSQKKVDSYINFLNPQAASQILNNYNYFFNQAKKKSEQTCYRKKQIYNDQLKSKQEEIQIEEERKEKIQEAIQEKLKYIRRKYHKKNINQFESQENPQEFLNRNNSLFSSFQNLYISKTKQIKKDTKQNRISKQRKDSQ